MLFQGVKILDKSIASGIIKMAQLWPKAIVENSPKGNKNGPS